ncbi:MAG: helix-turn-helix domain-containing protein [Cellvibrio sp.]|uniref:response regulator transcription factor n=1 Tax=Cellvibrio sp. TaxID=1965322 RepID=UPI0031AC535A
MSHSQKSKITVKIIFPILKKYHHLYLKKEAMHLLLIDEENDLKKTLTGLKTIRKITVDYCCDVPGASRRLQKKQYDLIVLEIFKNNECHLDSIAELRQISSTPIIVITKFPSISTAILAVKSGADDYYAKASDPLLWITKHLNKIGDNKVAVEEPKYTPIGHLQWDHMKKMLQQTKGNISAAARLLGINRRTLHRKISAHEQDPRH